MNANYYERERERAQKRARKQAAASRKSKERRGESTKSDCRGDKEMRAAAAAACTGSGPRLVCRAPRRPGQVRDAAEEGGCRKITTAYIHTRRGGARERK